MSELVNLFMRVQQEMSITGLTAPSVRHEICIYDELGNLKINARVLIFNKNKH